MSDITWTAAIADVMWLKKTLEQNLFTDFATAVFCTDVFGASDSIHSDSLSLLDAAKEAAIVEQDFERACKIRDLIDEVTP